MSEKEYRARCESLFTKNTVLLNQQKIDAEQIRALQKQNGELTDSVRELENKLENIRYYLDNEIPHELINEATTIIYKMV